MSFAEVNKSPDIQYSFDMLRSDDSTDEEGKTNRPMIPAWSSGKLLNYLFKLTKTADLYCWRSIHLLSTVRVIHLKTCM